MKTPSGLPAPERLKPLMQAMATLDAILSPSWEYRYYSFDARWSNSQQIGSIRNGLGDSVFVLFSEAGCILKGYSHEYPSAFTPESFYQTIPREFSDLVEEPAFSPQQVSFCYWYSTGMADWQSSVKESDIDERAFFLLQDLDSDPVFYVRFASDYFEADIDPENVASVLQRTPMSNQLAKSLNPEIDFSSLLEELAGIGFPAAT